PWSLEFEALKRMPARSYGVLVTLEPAAAVVIGILLLGETLTWATFLAVACVTLAALGITLYDRKGAGGGAAL
ncbi:MAG: EamA family transporter, partial [Methyloligellaceae bacterium]